MEDEEEKISKIQELQNKLYSEDNELFEKILKTEEIINMNSKYQKLSKSQLNILEIQFQAMRTYHSCISARINDYQQEIWKIQNLT